MGTVVQHRGVLTEAESAMLESALRRLSKTIHATRDPEVRRALIERHESIAKKLAAARARAARLRTRT